MKQSRFMSGVETFTNRPIDHHFASECATPNGPKEMEKSQNGQLAVTPEFRSAPSCLIRDST